MTKEKRTNGMLWLVIGLPVASVLMGVVTIILATGSNENVMHIEEAPLSKTSWRAAP